MVLFAKNLRASLLATMALTGVLVSCGSGSKNTEVDTLNAEGGKNEVSKIEVKSLPDTSYSSTGAVKYKIEILDTLDNGSLGNLADLYADAPGVFTFRGGLKRQADFIGKVKGTPSEINIDWEFQTAVDNRKTKYGTWGGGSGWTGQPLYVVWPDSCINKLKKLGVVNENFKREEIIVGSLASKVYFIDFATGKASRSAIDVENPIKGTISLDPALNGNLYVGHGVPAVTPWGARVVDLYKHSITQRFNEDPKAQRHWHAYDSSPLHVGRFVFRPGENGTLYKCSVTPGHLKIHSTLRYTVNGAAPGIESSMAVYANYGYLCDNHGNVLCVNLDNLKPVWRNTTGDDTDATPVVMIEDGRPYVYVGCEIDRTNAGNAKFMKIDGLNGNTVWTALTPGRRHETEGGKHFDGGYYSSALPGVGDCEDLIFANCVSNLRGQNGDFVAISRKDGKVVYRTPLRYYAWSSPVAFVNENNKMFVVTGDCSGNIYVIDGRSGKILVRRHVGNNFESSPVVVGSSLVVGSRGNTIYKLSIR